MAITRFGDPEDAYRAYMAKKQMGSDCSWKRGVLQETFKDKKAREIAKIIMKEQKEFKEKMEGEMEIKYWMEENEV